MSMTNHFVNVKFGYLTKVLEMESIDPSGLDDARKSVRLDRIEKRMDKIEERLDALNDSLDVMIDLLKELSEKID